MGDWMKMGMATLTVVIAATGSSVAQQASADDVEALRKQNADLQKRLETLSGEMDQIRRLIAGQAAGEKPVPSKLDLAFYGYVKLDVAYDSSRISAGNFARWVESEQIRHDDDEFNMTANETRVGLRLSGPPSEDIRFGGVVELDFYSGIGADNSPSPRLRLANVTVDWPEIGFGVLAGQAKDLISPLDMRTVNYSPGWWQGNIGFRRPQIQR